jgi:hypothetical protein
LLSLEPTHLSAAGANVNLGWNWGLYRKLAECACLKKRKSYALGPSLLKIANPPDRPRRTRSARTIRAEGNRIRQHFVAENRKYGYNARSRRFIPWAAGMGFSRDRITLCFPASVPGVAGSGARKNFARSARKSLKKLDRLRITAENGGKRRQLIPRRTLGKPSATWGGRASGGLEHVFRRSSLVSY